MDEMLFTTFYHINDYNEQGFANLPSYIASSYPIVLWSPSGRLLTRCYKDGICPITPEQFLQLVEAGYIHIIGREWWFEKSKRLNYPWPDGVWLDGFDDRITAILRERERSPEHERSVRIVEEQDGPAWAENYIHSKDASIITIIERLIREHRVPQGVEEKASRKLQEGNRVEAVKMVLRDLRNHVKSKSLAKAKVPFLSQKDADFFRLMETEGNLANIDHKIVVSAEMGRAIEELVDRLAQPEQVPDLTNFLGSSLHRELVGFFSRATDDAMSTLGKDLAEYLQARLYEYALIGRLSSQLRERVIHGTPLFAPETGTDDAMLLLIGQIFDSGNRLGISTIDVDFVPIGNGFSRDVEMVEEDDMRPYWPHLSKRTSDFP